MGQRLTTVRRLLPLFFNWGFACALSVLGFIGLLLTAIISRNEPGWDGVQVWGFPFRFYEWGGLVDSGDGTGTTYRWAWWPGLVYDLLIILAGSLVVGVLFGLCKRWRVARRSPGREGSK